LSSLADCLDTRRWTIVWISSSRVSWKTWTTSSWLKRYVSSFVCALTNAQIIRLDNGFHTTEREKHEWDAQKEKDDKNTEVLTVIPLVYPSMLIFRKQCERCWN
jgi:hypothetical protein